MKKKGTIYYGKHSEDRTRRYSGTSFIGSATMMSTGVLNR